MKDLGQQVFWASILGTDLMGQEISGQQKDLKLLLTCLVFAQCKPGPAPLAPVFLPGEDEATLRKNYTQELLRWATSCKNAADTLYSLIQQEFNLDEEKPDEPDSN